MPEQAVSAEEEDVLTPLARLQLAEQAVSAAEEVRQPPPALVVALLF
jgi:hypothetical protein